MRRFWSLRSGDCLVGIGTGDPDTAFEASSLALEKGIRGLEGGKGASSQN